MGSEKSKEQVFDSRTYLRLLRYARPYWLRLAMGILAGILVGGSLLFSLLLIPQLIGIVDPLGDGRKSSVSAEARSVMRVLEENPSAGREVLLAKVEDVLHPADNDPKLTAMLKKGENYARKYNLPITIEKRTIHVSWPTKFSFEVADSNGRIAWQIFLVYIAVFVLAWIVKNVAIYLNHYYTSWVGARVVSDMREEAFRKLTRQSLRFYGNTDVGQLVSRCTNDTSAIESAVSSSIADLTCAPIQILSCLIATFLACRQYDSYSLLVILIVGMPLVVVPVHAISRKVHKYFISSFSRIADVFSRMVEVFSGIRVVIAYHTEEQECRTFQKVNREYLKQVIKAMRIQLFMSPAMEIVSVSSTLVFLLYSYGQGVSITELSALLLPAFMAYQPIKSLSRVFAQLQRSMAAAERYFELIDTDTSLPEKKDAVEFTEFKDAIRLENAVFSYDNSRNILDGVTLDIPRGHVVAVVGETGSGKTTIANLIARFYDVTGGKVTIDGIDVRDYSIDSLRKKIGVVTQDAILFNDTIANNIAYGCPDATREQVIEAAKLANAHEFIMGGNHAEHYDSNVGEKGFKLSGGEKQRVAIARAILRNPPILILDEATSALDTVTEKLVQEALNRVMSNRTVFAIAHRLSTIRHANCIVVLKEGRIAEFGTHEELLKLKGLYRKLHDTQFDLKH